MCTILSNELYSRLFRESAFRTKAENKTILASGLAENGLAGPAIKETILGRNAARSEVTWLKG
ncbi:hypothetical protein C8K44_11368 [Aminobacter sp. AP02]|nr:hypothetical protein C8K44_11368 [Aminobacter sp. AP02]